MDVLGFGPREGSGRGREAGLTAGELCLIIIIPSHNHVTVTHINLQRVSTPFLPAETQLKHKKEV